MVWCVLDVAAGSTTQTEKTQNSSSKAVGRGVFGGGRVQLTAPWPGVASGGGRIVDVALYGAGGGGLRGSLEAFGMGSIWVSDAEVLRRRDAMDLALGTGALKSDDADGEAAADAPPALRILGRRGPSR